MTETLRVLVTGACGYIGSRVCGDLLEAGHEVVPVDNFYAPKVEAVDGLDVREVDVRDRGALREAADGADAVFHLAAITGVVECEENPEAAFDVNVAGTENVAWLCREAEVPLVFPASMAIIGDPVEFPITAGHPRNPLNTYGLTKLMNETDVHQLAEGAFPAFVFMKSNLYGHHEVGERTVGKRTVINVFVEKALAGEALSVHEPGTQARDFVHVKDIARAYRCALPALLDADPGAVTVPVAGGECRSVLDIAETVQRIVEEERGDRPAIEMVENPRGAETEAEDFRVDTGPAKELFGFEPEYTVERAVREMVS